MNILEKNILVLLIVCAFLIRVWGISFGLPFFFHFDESSYIYTAFYSASNNLRPDIFIHPMLYSYILIILYGMVFLLGFIFASWKSGLEFFSFYVYDPTIFLLVGRIFNVVIGTLSVFLIFKIGKKIYSEIVGLIAAGFLAFSFLHVQESHYLKEDILIGLFSLTCVYVNYQIIKTGKLKYFLISGLLFGLMASLKYHFFILIPPFLYSSLFTAEKIKKIFYAAVTSAFIFFLLNLYILIERKAVYEIISQLSMTTNQWVSSDGYPVWIYNIIYYLKNGLGLPILVLFFAGSIFKKDQRGIMLFLYPATYFLILYLFSGANFSRYLLIILPQVILISAWMISVIASKVTNKIARSITFATLFTIAILPSLTYSLKFDYYLTAQDTRIISKNWIEKNIPANFKIANEGAIRTQYLSVHGPPLSLDIETIDSLIKEAKQKNLTPFYLQALKKANKGRATYTLYGTNRLDLKYDPSTLKHNSLNSTQYYKNNNYCFLITSSWAKGDKDSYSKEFSDSLKQNYMIFKTFRPQIELREDPVWKVDFENLSKVNLKDKFTVGPIIEVYQLKNKICLISAR